MEHASRTLSPMQHQSLNRMAAAATLHCLTGCAIGEVLGMVIGTALGWSNAATIALAIGLAFFFGYSLTMVPLLRAGLALSVVVPLAFAADTFSIAVMEIVDNGVMLAVPGAMDAPLTNPLFWGALAFALAVAYVVAFPFNRYMIGRGLGHAVVHGYHGHGGSRPADATEAHDHGAHHHGHGAPGASTTVQTDHDEPRGVAAPWKMVATGIAAMAVTIGVAAGGALLLERDGDPAHAGAPDHDTTEDEMPEGRTSADGRGGSGHETMAGAAGGLAVAAGEYRLEVARTTFAAGERTPFRFAVVGAEGPVRRFDEHGGVQMHLIVVRRDLTGYQHLHPTLTADGSWETDLTLPRGGVYRAYADFERDGEQTVLGVDLLVGGAFEPDDLPRPAATASVDGYQVELEGQPEAGAEATLTYRITRDGRPIDVEPYLGAAGHLVALREGDLAYLHVHPLAEEPGEISFAATFPSVANYRLFLQFKHEGRVQTVALTTRVGRGHGGGS